MKTITFEESLTEAEKTCTEAIREAFGVKYKTFRSTNGGNPDCQVFDIGYLNIGENTTFPSAAYCFRAQLDLYRRDREALQRAIMSLLSMFPRNQSYNSTALEGTNVLCFRITPEPRAITEITTTDVSQTKDANPIPCYTATVSFDVVFLSRFD